MGNPNFWKQPHWVAGEKLLFTGPKTVSKIKHENAKTGGRFDWGTRSR